MTPFSHPDLHTHTTASDGAYAPERVAAMAAQAGVDLWAVTDHDTADGIGEARKAALENGIFFLPGVEISTEGEKEIHILGYGIRESDPALQSFFTGMKEERIARARQIGAALARLGMPLDLDAVIASAGASVGRAHIARAMVAAGYAATAHDAFALYIGRGKPAYVPRKYLSAIEAVEFLRQHGAVPVLAHPALLNLPEDELAAFLDRLQKHGLAGMEVYHPANRAYYTSYAALARERGLLVTGGSDFHAEDTFGHGWIGETAGEWPDAQEDVKKLLRLCEQV